MHFQMQFHMKLKPLAILTLSALSLLFSTSCSSPSRLRGPNNSNDVVLIRSDYTPNEIKQLCSTATHQFVTRLEELGGLLKKTSAKNLTFENTFAELEDASADFAAILSPIGALSSLSVNADVRKSANECESTASTAAIEVYTRKDLYQVMKEAQKNLKSERLAPPEARLMNETLVAFKLSGLELSDDKLQKYKKIQQLLSDLSIQFHAHLNNNNDSAEMSEEEMAGIPETVKSRFTKLPRGKYQIPAKTTYYMDFMENASNSQARKKMYAIYNNREAKSNTELLQKTVRLRREAAELLGFKDWADYRTYDKMAKTGRNAWQFLQDLKSKMTLAYKKDFQELLNFKKSYEPQSNKFEPWDTAYYSHHLKIKNYSVDDELIREYFPADYVVKKMFEIYSKLLGVNFTPVRNTVTWHSTVNLFEMTDAQTHKTVGYFYTDLYPREGKYNHAAAFPLRSGREINGQYQPPIAAIVANLNPPTKDRPSLLSHDDVETLFHEFGHVMHMTLTKAKYASLSGASVAGDFVEAPSQMLENWVWQPEILRMITAHYSDHSKKMSDELIEKLIRSRKFNQAYGFNGQLLYGIYDLTLHQSPKDLDVTVTFQRLYKEIMLMDLLPDTHFPASFGHIMGGYDAGYYGYLWSNVYAFDMFTLFENGKLLSPQVGLKYRQTILEKGNLKEASVLLQDFLNRKPNSNAFFRYLGIKK